MIQIYDTSGNLFAELNYSKQYFRNYSLHSHETICFALLAAGSLDIKIHGKKTEALTPEMLVVFNINEVHKTSAKTSDNKDYFTLHLSTNWYENFLKKNFSLADEDFILENFIYEKNIYKELLSIFRDMEDINKNRNIDLEKILTKIFHKYKVSKNITQQNNDLLSEVKNYILNNIYNPITAEDIAQHSGYSTSHISRVFKNKYGLSPHAFLINKRIEKARMKLLNSPNINLANLSQEVCFFDQSHFSKTFKKVFAISPNKYLNKVIL